nr:MAG TPA: hypothetical protein [Caudoviricetes sp.]
MILSILQQTPLPSHPVAGFYCIRLYKWVKILQRRGVAPQKSSCAAAYTASWRYERYRRVCTSGFYRRFPGCPERLYEIQRGYYLTFASLLVFPSCVIRYAYRKR